MNIKANLDNMLKQAQNMQSKMERVQENLSRAVVTGSAGDDLVQVKMNGRHDVLEVSLNPLLLKETKVIMENLIAAAINAAVQKVEEMSRQKLSELTMDIQSDLGTGADAD